jgi:hypothetical protein
MVCPPTEYTRIVRGVGVDVCDDREHVLVEFSLSNVSLLSSRKTRC